MSCTETPFPTSPPSAPKSPLGASEPVLGLSKFSTATRLLGAASCPQAATPQSSSPNTAATRQKKRHRGMNHSGRSIEKTSRRWIFLTFCQVICKHAGTGFRKLLLRFGEGIGEITFDI